MSEVIVSNAGVLFLVVLFSCLEEERELDTVFFTPCKFSALVFPEGQVQWDRGWNKRTRFLHKSTKSIEIRVCEINTTRHYMLNYFC